MVVMKTLAKHDYRHGEVVAASILCIEGPGPEAMCQGVYRKGAVIDEDRADEEPPHQELQRIRARDQCAGSRQRNGQCQWRDQKVPVQPADFREGGQIADQGQVRVVMLTAQNPSDGPPQKLLATGECTSISVSEYRWCLR